MPIIPLADGLIERLVMHVKEPPPMERSRSDHRRVPTLDELRHEVMALLAMDDAGRRAVLALQEDAGVDHDVHEESRLALGEAKR
jgi:hypothetical protein